MVDSQRDTETWGENTDGPTGLIYTHSWTGHPGGPMVIFRFYGPMFFCFVFFSFFPRNGINTERWWIGQMLGDV